MRILDKAGISYNTYYYEWKDDFIDGVAVAEQIGRPSKQVYKTLVAQGVSGAYYVFIIPVETELELKAAARAVNEKAVEMIKVKDLTKVTGYIRGGCSPIGMKKEYISVLDSSAILLKTIIISAGKPGHQMELSPDDLVRLISCKVEDIAFKKTMHI